MAEEWAIRSARDSWSHKEVKSTASDVKVLFYDGEREREVEVNSSADSVFSAE